MTDACSQAFSKDYLLRLKAALDLIPAEPLEALVHALMGAWRDKKQVFIFGNGGSAGNAFHLANDFVYGISRQLGCTLRVTALPANSAVFTCLANDECYVGIFFRHQAVLFEPRCRIPDDCIDPKRYPLFMAREVMRQLIDNLCVTTAVQPGALS